MPGCKPCSIQSYVPLLCSCFIHGSTIGSNLEFTALSKNMSIFKGTCGLDYKQTNVLTSSTAAYKTFKASIQSSKTDNSEKAL